jgi:hypothetical protein
MIRVLSTTLFLSLMCSCVKPYVYRVPNQPGVFIATGFSPQELLDNHGEGYKNFLKNKLAGLTDYAVIKKIWFEAEKSAVPQLLESKGLVPSICVNGVEVVSTSLQEGMQVSARFVCK